MLPFRQLFLWQFLVVIVNCDYLLVDTASGPVRGVEEKTFLSNKAYLSYRGIKYAQPPIGELRFRVPVPIEPWRKTLQANKYGDSCLVVAQSQLFPLNSTQSEDCLSLNIFTPVIELQKKNKNKAVMFFIHGGAFTEGDGTNGFYGPDFLIEQDVVLVTINYRLGPWGFANFEEPGFTGNMGFKDQQLALEWIKKNIEYFGGDPNLITIFGESAGGTSVHLHVLSDKSRKCIKRAIAMSGASTFYFSHYEKNNHIELLKDTFQLSTNSTGSDVLKFMQNAPTDLILQKAPVINLPLGLVELFWGAVVEDERKAENPFLTRNPRDIYRTRKIDIDMMFGVTSAEYLVLLNPGDLYSWVNPMQIYSNIGMPFHGLTLSSESPKFIEMQKLAGQFYFGSGEIEATITNLNKFVKMNTDNNFIYPIYEAMQMHSQGAKTLFYQSNLQLRLNFVRSNLPAEIYGTSHFEDLLYLFLANKYSQIYADVMANQDDVTNQKTLNAFHFVPKLYADYAKTGSPANFKKFERGSPNCMEISNDGLRAIVGPRKEAFELWDRIYYKLKPWIFNQF